MGGSLDTYVAQRVPAALLDEALADGRLIEVHGVYPDHLPRLQARLVHQGHVFAPTKTYNVTRPKVFAGPGGRAAPLLVAVPPGRDYVLHNASLLRHHVVRRGHPPEAVSVVRYPVAEAAVAAWTGLAGFVEPGDRVLMGYVAELLPLLLHGGRAELVERRDNACYGARRLRLADGGTLCLLGVRFSFWGCIAGRLAAACQALGADEIVYAGKLGTLTTPADVYSRLFLPSTYFDLRYSSSGQQDSSRLLSRAAAPPNRLLELADELDSGLHLSVGTVLEEDVAQRTVADSYAVASIDNEIAQMARALAEGAGGHRTAFSALHFATDYLRRPGEPEGRPAAPGPHDHPGGGGAAPALRLLTALLGGQRAGTSVASASSRQTCSTRSTHAAGSAGSRSRMVSSAQ